MHEDPKVKEIYSSTNMDYTRDLPARYELEAAERQAMLRCLRSKGLAPPGRRAPVQPHP